MQAVKAGNRIYTYNLNDEENEKINIQIMVHGSFCFNIAQYRCTYWNTGIFFRDMSENVWLECTILMRIVLFI